MIRSTIVHWSGIAFLGIGVLAGFGCTEKEPAKPNIIFLLTDDQRWDALGTAGNKIIQTPDLDRLAENGAMFTIALPNEFGSMNCINQKIS